MTSKTAAEKSAKGKGGPLQDVETLAQAMMLEAKTSLPNAARVVGKLIAVSALGFTLAGGCVGNYCSSRIVAPIGVLMLAVAAGWLDLIGNECKSQRFFPSKGLNQFGAFWYRWEMIVFWAVTIYAFLTLGSFISIGTGAWLVCKMALVPLILMLLGRAIEPFRFRHARSDIQQAQLLLQQLAGARTTSQISALAPIIEPEKIPLYKLGSIAKMLQDFVASYDSNDKLKVCLTDGQDSAEKGGVLSTIYAPFRRVAGDLLLWESRDVVLYAVMALYAVLVYVGSFYFPWSPLCILIPFMGPKSRAARCIAALQENIRLTQGKVAEKKGGLEPATEFDNREIINWPMVIYIGLTHILAVWALIVMIFFGGLCPYFGKGEAAKWETYIFGFFMYVFNALGVTAGVHRLWAHRSYKANLPLRIILMIFNSIANQGTIFHWARDHRLHHKYSDTPADPHDANRGFWFSHVGWLLVKKNKAVKEAGKTINVSDLLSDGVVMFQKRGDPFWMLMWCFAFPAFTVTLWGDCAWHGFLIAGVLRYVWALNATWAVNSVVHAWGCRPYNPSHLTTENGWVSVFAIGEGWHNWHHAFPWDYAAAELGALSQFNPTKMFIDAMVFLGMASDRKRALDAWDQRKKRWVQEQGRPVVESVEGPPLFKHRMVTFGPDYANHEEEETEKITGDMITGESVDQ